MKIPDPPHPPRQFSPSFKDLGLVAQAGRLIELRAPDPDQPASKWARIWLTPDAAQALLNWLPDAIAEQSPKKAAVDA